MLTTLFGAFLGLVLGVALGGPLGGCLGVVVGTALAMMWSGCQDAARPVPADVPLVRERQRIMCETSGRVATTGFVRDGRTGKWLDVDECSLCEPHDQVRCAKRCLVLIRGVLPARRHPLPTPP